MALTKDGVRVFETTTTTGTADLALAGAVVGFNTFLSEIGNANTCYYILEDANGIDWEEGLGTVGSGTLARTSILKSTNSNNKISLTTGTHRVIQAQMPLRQIGLTDLERFPNTKFVFDGSLTYGGSLIENHNIGAAATGTANASDANIYGVGFYGSAWTNSATRCTGVVGEGHVTATGDTGTATGLRGYAHDTHAGGSNVGLYGSAQNGATNYALYLHTGNIYTNAEAKTWDINGDITFDEFTYGFKGLTLANYNERIDARGTLTSGTLTLATTTGNVITATQNGSITIAMPSTFTSVGARKIQLDLTYTAGTLTLPTPSSSFKWVGGSAPTISTTSGKINRFLFATNDGTNWTANYVGAY